MVNAQVRKNFFVLAKGKINTLRCTQRNVFLFPTRRASYPLKPQRRRLLVLPKGQVVDHWFNFGNTSPTISIKTVERACYLS